jgi:sarcosine oxidase delta subunit
MSIFAVENDCGRAISHWRRRNGCRAVLELKMRMFETATVGVVALAAQILVVATVML